MKKYTWVFIVLGVVLLISSACFLATYISRMLLPSSSVGPLVRIDIPTPQRPTLHPTLTPRPQPTETTAITDGSFRLELKESDVADLVGELGLSAQGMRISNVRAVITPEQIIATFNASHAESGLSGEMTLVGVPRVVAGALYLEVVDFSLGSSFTGFTRLIASALVQSVLDRYNTGSGIPIPVQGVQEISSVELRQGLMIVTGTFR